jgi:hypothetical protein
MDFENQLLLKSSFITFNGIKTEGQQINLKLENKK